MTCASLATAGMSFSVISFPPVSAFVAPNLRHEELLSLKNYKVLRGTSILQFSEIIGLFKGLKVYISDRDESRRVLGFFMNMWVEKWMRSTLFIIHANQSLRHMMAAQGMHFGVIKQCCSHSTHCVNYKRNLPVCDVSKESGNCCPYHRVLVRDRLAGHDGDHPAWRDVLHHAVQGDVAVLPQEPDDGVGDGGGVDGHGEGSRV